MNEEIKKGQIIRGKVINIKPYGAFVLLPGNKKGLIHISEISDSFVRDINEFVMQGDILNVKVIDDRENKVALSLKDVPQDDINDKDVEDEELDFKNEKADFEPNRKKTLDELIKDFNRQSNDRQVDINKRLKKRN